MRKCPFCNNPVTGHVNKKYCTAKCKDRYHNTQPNRIERSKKHTKLNTTKECTLSKLLDQKLNHPFRGMTKYGDQD